MQKFELPDPTYTPEALAIVQAANLYAAERPTMHPAAAIALIALADPHVRAWWGPTASASEAELSRITLPPIPSWPAAVADLASNSNAASTLRGQLSTTKFREMLGLRFVRQCWVRALRRAPAGDPAKDLRRMVPVPARLLNAIGVPYISSETPIVVTRGDILFGLAHTPELAPAVTDLPRGFYGALDAKDAETPLEDFGRVDASKVRSAAIVAMNDETTTAEDLATFLRRAFDYEERRAMLVAQRVESRGAERVASVAPELAHWTLAEARKIRDQVAPSLELRCVVESRKV